MPRAPAKPKAKPSRQAMQIAERALEGVLIPAERNRHKLELPALPPGCGISDHPEMALDWNQSMGPFLNGGGYLNTVPGVLGFGLYFPGYPYLSEIAQRSEYRQPTETTAKELTRKWVVLKSTGKGDKSDRIEKLNAAMRRFRVQEMFRKVAEYDGFFGLGHLFIDIKGQDNNHAEPLKIEKETIAKGSLNALRPIEPMWTTPLVWNSTDPTREDFYKPVDWMVLGKRTSADRLLSFISRPVPQIIRPAYNFGGISLSQLIQPYVDRWLKTVNSVSQLISNFSIITLQTDLSQIMQGGGRQQLDKRMRLFNQTRDNQGTFAIDKATELLDQIAVPLSGLSELQAQAQEHMAAPTHLPLPVLTGITPDGLNASSEGDIEIYHDWIHSQQEALFRQPLDLVLRLLQLNEFGDIDDDIIADFVPLKELTGEALARSKKNQADMDQIYIDSGVVSPQEVRERVAADKDSGYVNLDAKKVIKPPQVDGDAPEPGDDAE